MSKKNLDHRGRWRSITIAFRVSPEENEDINMRVKMSGLTKQDYISLRCREKDVVVNGNPRVYKALKESLAVLCEEVQKLDSGTDASPEFWEAVQLAARITAALEKS